MFVRGEELSTVKTCMETCRKLVLVLIVAKNKVVACIVMAPVINLDTIEFHPSIIAERNGWQIFEHRESKN
jgi:hypothetical protein